MLGTLDRPRFEGIAEIAQGSFRLPGGQTILSGIDGTILLSEDEVIVDGSGFRFMQGRGVASGRVNWRAGIISLDLAGEMNGLRYPVLPGVVARLSGPWRLSGPTDDLHISGDLRVDRASLQRRDDAVGADPGVVRRHPGPTRRRRPEPRSPRRGRPDHRASQPVCPPRGLGVAPRDRAPPTQPGLVGKVEFEEGGEVTLQNLRYDLERGTFTFADPDRIDPNIELQLRTWVQNYQVTLRVAGTSDRLVPRSPRARPCRRRRSTRCSPWVTAATPSAAAPWGSVSHRPFCRSRSPPNSTAGPSSFCPTSGSTPIADSPTSGPAARVTVVQQIAKNWTVTLQSNLSAERAEVIVSRWYLAPGIFLEATRELDGSYGVDIKMRRPY